MVDDPCVVVVTAFTRRTVLKFVLPGDEGVPWQTGLGGLCAGFGLRVLYLDQKEIEELIHWVMHPDWSSFMDDESHHP